MDNPCSSEDNGAGDMALAESIGLPGAGMPTLLAVHEPIKYCRRCSYALVGLTQSRCPECGWPYHPRRPWTYYTAPRGRWWIWLILSKLGAVAVWIVQASLVLLVWICVVWSVACLVR